MLSFRALSEKKTKIKINPKQSEITEKKGCPKCEDECGKECKCSCHDKEMSESTYDPMEDPDFDHDEAERTRGQSGKNKSITIKKKTKKTTKEETAYVSQEEVSEESNQSIAETETLLTFGQFCEGRAEDAQASLAKVKARQKVLDAHEKKTGRKLDITKTPEHKAHKKEFPGAKRTGKKVKGAKETPAETHNRRVSRQVSRVVNKGYTSKEKKEVESMAKHTSRYD